MKMLHLNRSYNLSCRNTFVLFFISGPLFFIYASALNGGYNKKLRGRGEWRGAVEEGGSGVGVGGVGWRYSGPLMVSVVWRADLWSVDWGGCPGFKHIFPAWIIKDYTEAGLHSVVPAAESAEPPTQAKAPTGSPGGFPSHRSTS